MSTPNEEQSPVLDMLDLAKKWTGRCDADEFLAALGVVAAIITPKCENHETIALEFVARFIDLYNKELDRLSRQEKNQ